MSKITSIITKKDNIVPATAAESWDISEAQDGSVMAYVEKTDEVLEPGPTNAKIYSNDEEVKIYQKRYMLHLYLKLTLIMLIS